MAINRSAVLTLIAAYLGLFVGLIDANAINLALPAIRTDLGGGISGAQWTIDAYNVTFAAVLLTAGSLGDRFGRRTLLRVGLVTFVAASLAFFSPPPLPPPHRARRGNGGMGDGRRDEHRDRPDPRRRADRHPRLAVHLLAERAGRR